MLASPIRNAYQSRLPLAELNIAARVMDFVSLPDYAPPPGAQAHAIAAPDGVALRAGLFPAPGEEKGGVILLPGRAEFIEKYYEVIGELHARGFSVAAMDWRGQGFSSRQLADPAKGHIDDFQTYENDLRFFLDHFALKRLKGPHLILAHSMGGGIVLRMLARGRADIAAAVLSAPMTRVIADDFKRMAARLLARLAVAAGLGEMQAPARSEIRPAPFEANRLTSDRARYERFRALQKAASQACVGAPTFHWLLGALRLSDFLNDPRRLRAIKTPVLIVSPRDDRIVDVRSHDAVAASLPNGRIVRAPGARHEILFETDDKRRIFWDAFDEFLGELASFAD